MVTINRKEFLTGITLGGAMAGKAKTMPILENVKCTLKGDKLVMSSYDTETAVTKRIQVVSNESSDMSFCVSPKELTSILRSVNDEEVKFNVESNQMTIMHKKGQLVVPTCSAEEYPSPTMNNTALGCDIPSEQLYNWIKEASYFVGTDEIKAILCGVFLYMEQGEIGVAATDGRRMYCNKGKCAYEGDLISCVLTSKSIASVLQLINGTETTNVLIGDTNIVFKNEDAMVCSRIVEGRYPNYKSIIPQTHNSECEICKNEILDSVKRAIIASDGSSNLVKLHINNICMDVSASDLTLGKKANETCICSYSGEELTIGVQGMYLVECVNCIQSSNVIMQFIDATRPIVLKDTDCENKIVLVMPMRVE